MPGPGKRRTEPHPAAAVLGRVAAKDTRRGPVLPSRAWGRLILSSRSVRALLAIVIAAAIWLPGLPFTMHGELLLTAMNVVLTVATAVIVLRCGTQR